MFSISLCAAVFTKHLPRNAHEVSVHLSKKVVNVKRLGREFQKWTLIRMLSLRANGPRNSTSSVGTPKLQERQVTSSLRGSRFVCHLMGMAYCCLKIFWMSLQMRMVRLGYQLKSMPELGIAASHFWKLRVYRNSLHSIRWRACVTNVASVAPSDKPLESFWGVKESAIPEVTRDLSTHTHKNTARFSISEPQLMRVNQTKRNHMWIWFRTGALLFLKMWLAHKGAELGAFEPIRQQKYIFLATLLKKKAK